MGQINGEREGKRKKREGYGSEPRSHGVGEKLSEFIPPQQGEKSEGGKI